MNINLPFILAFSQHKQYQRLNKANSFLAIYRYRRTITSNIRREESNFIIYSRTKYCD